MEDTATVVLALDAPDVAEEVLDFLDRSGRARVVATASDGRQLQEAVRQLEPHAVVADPAMVPDGVTCGTLLALAVRESVGSLRRAIGAGASGYFVWPGERQELVDAVAATAAARGAPERTAQVVAGRGARGSAGCTFVATHLAQVFAKQGASCLLLDLDVVRGDVAVALGLAADEHRTLADLVPVASELTSDHVREAAAEHQAGFHVLLAPPIGSLGQIDSSFVKRVVEMAASSAEVVLLHLPRELDDVTGWCLATADRVLEVLSLDVLSLRASSRTLEAMASLEIEGRLRLVIDRMGRSDITPRDVERAFPGMPVSVIPMDGAVARAQDRGRLLPPRGRVGRAFDRLASDLLSDRAGRPDG